jgi:hypothetical protein
MFGNDMLRVKQRSGGRFAPSYFVAGLKPPKSEKPHAVTTFGFPCD